MRVLLLGPFEVRDDGRVEVAGTRVRALLARLALEPGRSFFVNFFADFVGDPLVTF